MSIRQYFGGRIRSIQVGDNGDSMAGIGCYAKSQGISQWEVTEIQKRYKMYLNTEQNSQGKYPTIYKRVFLSEGTILVSATSYIPSVKGSFGAIDRPNWIDHIYMVNASDPAALDPEQWIGLPFRTDNPNPTWELMPPEAEKSLIEKGVYKTEKWISAKELEKFPESEFGLLMLPDVMEMWNLKEIGLVRLIEAVMDCVSAPDRGGRRLFIKYNINAEDCSDSRFWDHERMDAEQFNRYRMGQLLMWIYHLIPFSYRRLLGYNTMLDAATSHHHIIFVPDNKIRKFGGEYGFRYPSFNGSDVKEDGSIKMIGGGYLYDYIRGIAHDASKGAEGYSELYKSGGIVQKLIEREVSAYMEAGTGSEPVQQTRRVLGKFYKFFERLENHLGIYSTSTDELAAEIARCDFDLIEIKELFQTVINLLERSGKEDIAVNTDNYEYFWRAASYLKDNAEGDDRSRYWTPVVEKALMRPAFKNQKDYVGELSSLILDSPDPLKSYKKYISRKDLQNASIENEKVLTRLFAELVRNGQFLNDWLLAQYKQAESSYPARLQVFSTVRKQIETIAVLTDVKDFHRANYVQCESMPTLTGINDVRELLLISYSEAEEEMFTEAAHIASDLVREYKALDIYGEVRQKGPAEFVQFRDSIRTSKMQAANSLTDCLLETVFDEWLGKFKTERISPKDLNRAVDLLNEEPWDSKREAWASFLTGIVSGEGTSDKTIYHKFTEEDLDSYISQVTGVDNQMLKPLFRCYLCGHALNSVRNGLTIPGRDYAKIISEYLTSEKENEKRHEYPEWLTQLIDENIESLTGVLCEQIRTDCSLKKAADLFDKLSDDNSLNSWKTLDKLLPEGKKVVEAVCLSGEASETDLHTFERAFRWWGSDPDVRAERRKIVKAAGYKPSFHEIRMAAADFSSQEMEKLADDGFIYDCDRYMPNSTEDLFRMMKRQPVGMTKNNWVKQYCDWTEEGLRCQDLGKYKTDYKLLNVMCEVLLGEGVKEISPGARVDQRWFKSLSTGTLKVDKLEKNKETERSLIVLLKVKEICEQMASTRPRKIPVDDASANGVAAELIANGKMQIQVNDKTLRAVCIYLTENQKLFNSILYLWRSDRVIRLIEMAKGQLGEQDQKTLRKTFNMSEKMLRQIYSDKEMLVFKNTLEK